MAYNGIVLYDNVKYNYLVVKKRSATQNELSLFSDLNYVPEWSDVSNSILLTTFDGSLVSSYLSGLPTDFTAWAVYRQKKGENVEHFVGKVSRNRLFLIDYLCANQTEYTYFVIPETDGEMGVSMQSPSITTDWWNYSLTSLKQIGENTYVADKVWLFDYNLTSTDIVQNTDVSTFKTFTKHPKVSKGLNNYQTMGISCLIGNVDLVTEKYNDNIELLNAWQNFVSQETLCLWKDRKGSIKVGVVASSPTSKYMDETIDQLTTITFNFIETMDVNNISVYNSQDNIVSNAYIDVSTLIGQRITVSGIGTKTAKDTITRFTVLSNTEYSISVNDKVGYITPDYALITTGDENSVTNVTMEYKIDPNYKPQEYVDIDVNISWDDENNKYLFRPENVTISLFENGEFKESKIASRSNDWDCSFLNLEKYDKNNDEISYSIEQSEISKYTTDIQGYTVINTFEGLKIETPVDLESAKLFVQSDYSRFTSDLNYSVHLSYEGDEYYVFEVRNENSEILAYYDIYLNGNVDIDFLR